VNLVPRSITGTFFETPCPSLLPSLHKANVETIIKKLSGASLTQRKAPKWTKHYAVVKWWLPSGASVRQMCACRCSKNISSPTMQYNWAMHLEKATILKETDTSVNEIDNMQCHVPWRLQQRPRQYFQAVLRWMRPIWFPVEQNLKMKTIFFTNKCV
jgi:hypothetical protein